VNAAEMATLGKISWAGSDARSELLASADPKIDEAIEQLQNAEMSIWGGLGTRLEWGTRAHAEALERLAERQRQIEVLREMKLQPQHFEHAASSPWRSYAAGEAAC